jgi:hypothetical protein
MAAALKEDEHKEGAVFGIFLIETWSLMCCVLTAFLCFKLKWVNEFAKLVKSVFRRNLSTLKNLF